MAHPVGANGFPVADIKLWNETVEWVQERLKRSTESANQQLSALSAEYKRPFTSVQEPAFAGSVEDLVSGNCQRCGKELIRQSIAGSRQQTDFS
jgi:hypothetical protein